MVKVQGKGTSKKRSLNFFLLRIIPLVMLFALGVIIFFLKTSGGADDVEDVLVLGIDGLDPDIVRDLIAEGVLPHFAELNIYDMDTIVSPQSPVAWASISTGTNPGKHNIFDFIRRTPENYLPILSMAKATSGLGGTNYESYIRGKPFWQYTSEHDIPTSVIRWPMTFPADRLNGELLAGLGVPDLKGLLSGYTYYTSVDDFSSDKTIKVDVQTDGLFKRVHTVINGPRKRTGSGVVELQESLEIEIDIQKNVKLKVSGQVYELDDNNWTDWMTITFHAGFAKKITGLSRAKVISTSPFKMYMTAVQIHPEKPLYAISYPKSFAKDLAKDIDSLYYTLGIPEDTTAYEDNILSKKHFLEHMAQIDDERTRMFWSSYNHWLKTGGLLAFEFDDSDRVQHVLSTENTLSQEVKDYYVDKDALLGKMLETFPKDAKLLIISDHGFAPFNTSIELNAWLVKEGYMVLKEEPKRGEDSSLFKLVDWSKTKAYSVGFAGIYINELGREGQGIVPVNEKDALIDELVEKLESFTDSTTGKHPIKHAYRADSVYHGPYFSEGPDILIGFEEGYRAGWESPIGGTPKAIITANLRKWNHDHILDPSVVPAVLITNFEIDTTKRPILYDIAPTILDMYGIEAVGMDGQSLLKK